MEVQLLTGLVVLAVTASLWKEVSGIACMSSKTVNGQDYVSGLANCSQIEECAPDEVCYVEKIILESSPSVERYKAGCRRMDECKLISCSNKVTREVTTHPTHNGTGYTEEISLCTECCYNDTCNTQGCGSNAIDPERAKYHKRCFFCSHIKEDDTSTCTTMDWCERPTQVCAIKADPVRRQYTLDCEEKKICGYALQASQTNGVPLLLKCFDGHLKNFNPLSNHSDTSVADGMQCPTMLVRPTTTTQTTTSAPTTTKLPTPLITVRTTQTSTKSPITTTTTATTTTTTSSPTTRTTTLPMPTTTAQTTTLSTKSPITTTTTATTITTALPSTRTTTLPMPTTTAQTTTPPTKAPITTTTATTTTTSAMSSSRTSSNSLPVSTSHITTHTNAQSIAPGSSIPAAFTSSLKPSTLTTNTLLTTTTRAPAQCTSQPCKHGGSCEDLPGTFHCYCMPGYVGRTCEEDHDECGYSGCKNGGVCTNTVGSFHCTCATGYTGPTCDTGSGCLDQPGFPCDDMLKYGMCGDTNIVNKCRNTCTRDLANFPCGDMLKFGMCHLDDIKEKCRNTCGHCSTTNSMVPLVG